MSRSQRKSKIFGITKCESEKQFKRKYNRMYRHKVRSMLKDSIDDGYGDVLLPELGEIVDIWSGNKDGKHYWKNCEDSDMRK